MADEFARELNDLFTEILSVVVKVEKASIKRIDVRDLSINELHLIDAIGSNRQSPKTISELAQRVGVTLPSMTVAINKLVKKGYVQKERGEQDARTVVVTLTRLGHKVDLAHSFFHMQMNQMISNDFSKEEKAVLLVAMDKFRVFFRQKLEEMAE